MQQPVVVIGMGELGDLFAQGFLKCGHPVYPVLRGMDCAEVAERIPAPALVLVAVGENDLHGALDSVPPRWRDRLGLLQNELLPRDWERHGMTDPTVIVVWFDKKKGKPLVALLPTTVCGRQADVVLGALQALEIPCREVSADERLYELVRKNLYILTINIAGIRTGGTVGELWSGHGKLVVDVANEILDVQEHLTRCRLPRKRILAGLLEGFAGDPQHVCMGRTAGERLHRTLLQAREAGISTPALSGIAAGG